MATRLQIAQKNILRLFKSLDQNIFGPRELASISPRTDRELLVGLAQVLEDPPKALLWLATLDLWERDGWAVAAPMEHP
jgi:hypothetical protein